MGIHAWAERKTLLCDSPECMQLADTTYGEEAFQAARSCKRVAIENERMLAGYCVLIWAQPVIVDGSFVGTAVLDLNAFRFFSADVRLDDFDGFTWRTLTDLQSGIESARSLILAKLSRGLVEAGR